MLSKFSQNLYEEFSLFEFQQESDLAATLQAYAYLQQRRADRCIRLFLQARCALVSAMKSVSSQHLMVSANLMDNACTDHALPHPNAFSSSGNLISEGQSSYLPFHGSLLMIEKSPNDPSRFSSEQDSSLSTSSLFSTSMLLEDKNRSSVDIITDPLLSMQSSD
ncbi:unnamed protein product [Protopolystoma xenopodis]|uniref:Uncharacterized protein n=1 Tax=Protopolystoma xenopodis TaxID=117903 RepID=A0A448WEN2_9PLAT|nr:unnamed protein product [Protopolystoma xenopodis]